MGRGRRGRRRRGGRGRRGPSGGRPDRAELHARRSDSRSRRARWVAVCRARRGGGRAAVGQLRRARAARLRSGRARRCARAAHRHGSAGRCRRYLRSRSPPRSAIGGIGALAWVAFKVGALVLRRRLRDRAVDADRCRAHLPLDELGPVPERGGARAGHSRAGGGDRSRPSDTPRTVSAARCSPRRSRSCRRS